VITTVALAAVVFAATNADDLVLLAGFFADDAMRPRAIVLGQLLGMGIICGVSLAAAYGAMAVPAAWVALLGLVPLALGIWKLVALRQRAQEADEESDVGSRWASQVLTVAMVTVANGGDNLGAYVPLFAARPGAVIVYGLLFAVLTLAWCLLAWWVARNATFGRHVRRYARVALPLVLILVGVDVLSGARPLLGW
jgi:cadmium resistance protein CadD (predicted permease)